MSWNHNALVRVSSRVTPPASLPKDQKVMTVSEENPKANCVDHRNTTPAQRLAIAVLAAAVEDVQGLASSDQKIQKAAMSAAHFLQGKGLFTFWCQVLDYDPEPAIEKGRKLVERLRKAP